MCGDHHLKLIVAGSHGVFAKLGWGPCGLTRTDVLPIHIPQHTLIDEDGVASNIEEFCLQYLSQPDIVIPLRDVDGYGNTDFNREVVMSRQSLMFGHKLNRSR